MLAQGWANDTLWGRKRAAALFQEALRALASQGVHPQPGESLLLSLCLVVLVIRLSGYGEDLASTEHGLWTRTS